MTSEEARILDGLVDELRRKEEPMDLWLQPISVLQLVGVVQLAARHPQFPASHAVITERFIRGALAYFADCPTILNLIERGFDPTQDRPVDREGMRQLIRQCVERAETLENDRAGRALTPDEVSTIRGGTFLREIAPYLFQPRANVRPAPVRPHVECPHCLSCLTPASASLHVRCDLCENEFDIDRASVADLKRAAALLLGEAV